VLRNNADQPKNAATAVQTTTVGRPLLRVPASWELFARGPGVLVRVQLAAGKITRTGLPQLISSVVSFVVGPDRAIIQALDSMPGYEVRDGKPAHDLSSVFGAGGMALPGRPRRRSSGLELSRLARSRRGEGQVQRHAVVTRSVSSRQQLTANATDPMADDHAQASGSDVDSFVGYAVRLRANMAGAKERTLVTALRRWRERRDEANWTLLG
jgi:hypothetical protein